MVADERMTAWGTQPGSADLGEVVAVTVTCLSDGRAHVVPDTEMVDGASHNGCYRAVCGHVVTAAPMVEPDGKPCRPCSTVHDVVPAPAPRWLGLRLLGG